MPNPLPATLPKLDFGGSNWSSCGHVAVLLFPLPFPTALGASDVDAHQNGHDEQADQRRQRRPVAVDRRTIAQTTILARRDGLVRRHPVVAWPAWSMRHGVRRRHAPRLLAGEDERISLRLSLEPQYLRGSNAVSGVLDYVRPDGMGDGADYRCSLEDEPEFDLWLCGVTEFVFGFMPKRIYFEVA